MDNEIAINEEFILPQDLSAMAKTFFVQTEKPLKCRGTAIVTNGTETFINCEIHWYQCANVGKIEFKVKVWSDKVEG